MGVSSNSAKLAAVAVLLLPSPAALAAGQPDPVDPETGSPSGAVYEIPLETSRRDAAPTGGSSHTTGTAAATPVPLSPGRAAIHSGNGYGSSTNVPGATDPTSTKARKSGKKTDSDARKPVSQGTSKTQLTERDALKRDQPVGERVSALSSGSSAVVPLIALAVAVLVGGTLGASIRRGRGPTPPKR